MGCNLPVIKEGGEWFGRYVNGIRDRASVEQAKRENRGMGIVFVCTATLCIETGIA